MSIVIFQDGILYGDKTAVFYDLSNKNSRWIKQGKKIHHCGDFIIGTLGPEIDFSNHPFVDEIRKELVKIEDFPTIGFKLPWPSNEVKDCIITIMTRKKFYTIKPLSGDDPDEEMVMHAMTDFSIPYICTSEMPIAMAMFAWGHTPIEIIDYISTVSPDITGFGIEVIEQSSLPELKPSPEPKPKPVRRTAKRKADDLAIAKLRVAHDALKT